MECTKGEWERKSNKIQVHGRGTIAICPSPTNDAGVFEFIANARLITQSPILLSQVKYALLCITEPEGHKLEAIRDAMELTIAQAVEK